MDTTIVGTVTGLAVRTGVGAAMQELDSLQALTDGGVEGDVPAPIHRGITLLSRRQWEEVVAEIGMDYPWYTRRANVLVDCDSLSHLMEQTIEIGDVVVQITGETDPCAVMEAIHPRLKEALTPEMRGGVYGRILQGGAIAIGATVTIRETGS